MEVAKAVKPQLPWPVSIAHEFVLEMFFFLKLTPSDPLANLAESLRNRMQWLYRHTLAQYYQSDLVVF